MAKHYNYSRFKNLENTGFGPNSNVEGAWLTNRDGSTNLRKTGLPLWERISVYHSLLRMKRSHFLLFVLLLYTSINLLFASFYFLIGVDHLSGAGTNTSLFDQF